ncbi:unnamed protein product [Periconia digitata]|uniref:Uncharacterized protein n=1 Tax=Periconia digitata TaxID=1303443 RepID=A0A9W4U209_9PLEO|nr:unnamed protein product [Periconia digitata]
MHPSNPRPPLFLPQNHNPSLSPLPPFSLHPSLNIRIPPDRRKKKARMFVRTRAQNVHCVCDLEPLSSSSSSLFPPPPIPFFK